MNIFIIGSGGREHALAWKVLQSPRVTKVYISSSNANASILAKQYPDKFVEAAAIADDDIVSLVIFAQQNAIDMVIVGSEIPLAAGIVDALIKAKIRVFGPTQRAAEIESSKVFSKDLMFRHQIQTSRYATFTDFFAALKYLHEIDYSIVIKASGLAFGKGVFLPESISEAEEILREVMLRHSLKTAGNEILIEKRLEGKEISLLAFTDGVTVKAMPPARDHKRLGDHDTGPNTGGMGTFAPADISAEKIQELVEKTLQSAIDALREEGRPFVGVLYVGILETPSGPYVLEYNCRFGDPETQVLLPLLETDLIDILEACIDTRLHECEIRWKKTSAICVVLASEGYPFYKKTGDVISGLEVNLKNTEVFQAGTQLHDDSIVTAGGRVLGVTAWADDLKSATELVYQRVAAIHFQGMQYRRDIGTGVAIEQITDPYAEAGVDIEVGNEAVKLMADAVRATYGIEVLAGIGAFGGMYDAARLKAMQGPVLVASTDGIGTKVQLAVLAGRLTSLGYDIVNHSVNDILVQNARPLFFLDYIAASQLNAEKIATVVQGMAEACREVKCALLGGETAEMPGVYQSNMLDVAGTIVGVVERSDTLPRKESIKAGDVLVGIASSGPHTNGYSLIRKIFANVALDTILPELNISLADAVLAPHRCYLPVLQKALEHHERPIKALIHITGGGFYENIPRVLPENLDAIIDPSRWSTPPLFKLIQQRGNVTREQMHRIFNMGIGMVIIVAPEQVALLKTLIGEDIFTIGELKSGEKRVILQ